MGASASVDGGQDRGRGRERGREREMLQMEGGGGARRYFCHRCRRPFSGLEESSGLSCPHCGGTFIEQVEEFRFPTAGRGGGARLFGVSGSGPGHINNRQDVDELGLTEEQRRRLFNAAALLQLLEAHLREELSALETAVRESESSKTLRDITGMEKHVFLKNSVVDADSICSQPSCPICGEDFNVGEEVMLIQCSHFFHETCVMPWLELKHNCPICRCEISDKLPNHAQIEELTATEIRQRIVWHGQHPNPAQNKAELAVSLHNILLASRQSYLDTHGDAAELENRAVSVGAAGAPGGVRRIALLTATSNGQASGGNSNGNSSGRSLRPGHTYTISSSGVMTHSASASNVTTATAGGPSAFPLALSPGPVAAAVRRGESVDGATAAGAVGVYGRGQQLNTDASSSTSLYIDNNNISLSNSNASASALHPVSMVAGGVEGDGEPHYSNEEVEDG